MLDYTQVAGRKIYNDVRRISLVCNVSVRAFWGSARNEAKSKRKRANRRKEARKLN